MPPEFLTPAVVAARLGLDKVDQVYRLIGSGELGAVNISSGPGRPTWRINEADLQVFLQRRRSCPAPKPDRRRKARRPAVVQYF